MQPSIIFQIAVLVMSVVIHEVSHGFVAGMLGDPTARLAGRLTLNPIKHLDPVGSVFVPLMLSLIPGMPILGWAKPVPYNPYNLKARRWGPALVAFAGPASNFIVAIFFSLLIRFGIIGAFLPPAAVGLSLAIVVINVVLGLFNLIPVPPLDGSKILFAALPYRLRSIEATLERFQFVFILVVLFFAGSILVPAVGVVVKFLTGYGGF